MTEIEGKPEIPENFGGIPRFRKYSGKSRYSGNFKENPEIPEMFRKIRKFGFSISVVQDFSENSQNSGNYPRKKIEISAAGTCKIRSKN